MGSGGYSPRGVLDIYSMAIMIEACWCESQYRNLLIFDIIFVYSYCWGDFEKNLERILQRNFRAY